jgi:hypothetical protein
MMLVLVSSCGHLLIRFAEGGKPRTGEVVTVSQITFGSGKQLFPGLTATGINSVRGALPVEIIDSLHFKL